MNHKLAVVGQGKCHPKFANVRGEPPKKFEFVINLKAAKQIGLTIPANMLIERIG